MQYDNCKNFCESVRKTFPHSITKYRFALPSLREGESLNRVPNYDKNPHTCPLICENLFYGGYDSLK